MKYIKECNDIEYWQLTIKFTNLLKWFRSYKNLMKIFFIKECKI